MMTAFQYTKSPSTGEFTLTNLSTVPPQTVRSFQRVAVLYDRDSFHVVKHGDPRTVHQYLFALRSLPNANFVCIEGSEWDSGTLNGFISDPDVVAVHHDSFMRWVAAGGLPVTSLHYAFDAEGVTCLDERFPENVVHGTGLYEYEVLLTLDTTAHRTIKVRADSAEKAEAAALDVAEGDQGAHFEMNEGNYVRACDLSVTHVDEIGEAEEQGAVEAPGL